MVGLEFELRFDFKIYGFFYFIMLYSLKVIVFNYLLIKY